MRGRRCWRGWRRARRLVGSTRERASPPPARSRPIAPPPPQAPVAVALPPFPGRTSKRSAEAVDQRKQLVVQHLGRALEPAVADCRVVVVRRLARPHPAEAGGEGGWVLGGVGSEGGRAVWGGGSYVRQHCPGGPRKRPARPPGVQRARPPVHVCVCVCYKGQRRPPPEHVGADCWVVHVACDAAARGAREGERERPPGGVKPYLPAGGAGAGGEIGVGCGGRQWIACQVGFWACMGRLLRCRRRRRRARTSGTRRLSASQPSATEPAAWQIIVKRRYRSGLTHSLPRTGTSWREEGVWVRARVGRLEDGVVGRRWAQDSESWVAWRARRPTTQPLSAAACHGGPARGPGGGAAARAAPPHRAQSGAAAGQGLRRAWLYSLQNQHATPPSLCQ